MGREKGMAGSSRQSRYRRAAVSRIQVAHIAHTQNGKHRQAAGRHAGKA